MQTVVNVNNYVNGIVWGPIGLALLFIAGLWMTARTGVFQISHFRHWMKKTIGAIFMEEHVTKHTEKDDRAISQFQSLCTALAATIGTGNIVGVSSAIVSGGPGAVFWMWIMAILGMMTNYSENVLGIYYRRKNRAGEWSGGAMYYLEDGLGSMKGMKKIAKVLAMLFAAFCALASFGIGNIAQVNSIASNIENAFQVPGAVTGIVIVILSGLVVIGGLKRIALVTEKLVPFMAVTYVILALAAILYHASLIPTAFALIFKGAFTFQAAAGGAVGYGIKMAITMGFKRGAFSNEAGLGSSVMVHSNSNVKEPVQQGMWGIFEVFADTIVVCTLTALVVITSGVIDLTNGQMLEEIQASALVGECFRRMIGPLGPMFIAIAVALFAFSTALGWSHYGTKAMEYLTNDNRVIIIVYKVILVGMSYFSATMSLTLAWDLSDTFNGLMMIPNLIGVLALSGTVAKITKNYINRTFHGSTEKPIYSVYPDIQREQEMADGE